jgi:hypothetical protein
VASVEVTAKRREAGFPHGLRGGRLVPLVVVLACAGALLGPSADPAALRAQGVARLLRADAERALAGETSLLGTLEEARGDTEVGVRLEWDGVLLESGREEEAVTAALRAFHRRLHPEGATEGVGRSRLQLTLYDDGARLAIDGVLVREGAAVVLPAPDA